MTFSQTIARRVDQLRNLGVTPTEDVGPAIDPLRRISERFVLDSTAKTYSWTVPDDQAWDIRFVAAVNAAGAFNVQVDLRVPLLQEPDGGGTQMARDIPAHFVAAATANTWSTWEPAQKTLLGPGDVLRVTVTGTATDPTEVVLGLYIRSFS